jgi:hypothetical protein
VRRRDPEPDDGDVRTLARGRGSDVLDVDLARDHVMAEPDHHLRQQLQPFALFVRDQNPQMLVLYLGHDWH